MAHPTALQAQDNAASQIGGVFEVDHGPTVKILAAVVATGCNPFDCDEIEGLSLLPSLLRSWVERDLHTGDLRVLSNFAFRTTRPPSAVVDQLCERGFLAKTERGHTWVTPKGWLAVFLRHTFARRD